MVQFWTRWMVILLVLCSEEVLRIQSEETMESMVDEFMIKADEEARQHWRRGELHKAEELYQKMVAHAPRHADSYFNVGLARAARGDLQGSIAMVEQALKTPSGAAHHSVYHQQLGASMCKLAERQNDHILWDHCLRHLSQAVYLDPLNVAAWATAATNYMSLGLESTAIRATRVAVRLKPKQADAWSALGVNYGRVGRHGEAMHCFREALALNPHLHRSRVEYLHAAMAIAQWDDYAENVAYVTELTAKQVQRGEHTFLQPFDALALPLPNSLLLGIASSYATDAARNTEAASRFTHTHPAPSSAPLFHPPPQRRVHVAYLSADWTDKSAVGRALGAGIALHDRYKILVSVYSLRNQKVVDDTSFLAVSALVERLVPLGSTADLAAADKINEDGVHILCNLNGYTSSARSEIFAYQPAPVQVLVQGYAGTSGASYLQYILVDKIQAPPEHAAAYSEKLQLLPVSAFRGEGTGTEAILSAAERAQARRRISLPESTFLAANFNRPFKLEPELMQCWLRFLNRTSHTRSQVWMFDWPEALSARHNLKRAAGPVLSQRLVFTPLLPIEMRIAGKAVADLMLDSWEYNAHGTATEVLAAGVPVLTVPGRKAHSSRVAASVIMALGLSELVARDREEYEEVAVRLAVGPGRLAKVKERLRKARGESVLFDKLWWVRRVEESYRMMIELWNAGESPMHLVVRDKAR